MSGFSVYYHRVGNDGGKVNIQHIYSNKVLHHLDIGLKLCLANILLSVAEFASFQRNINLTLMTALIDFPFLSGSWADIQRSLYYPLLIDSETSLWPGLSIGRSNGRFDHAPIGALVVFLTSELKILQKWLNKKVVSESIRIINSKIWTTTHEKYIIIVFFSPVKRLCASKYDALM